MPGCPLGVRAIRLDLVARAGWPTAELIAYIQRMAARATPRGPAPAVLHARALVATRPDRLLWGSDWPHLPDGQRDTGEILNLLAGWAPDEADRRTILVDGPDRLFFR